MADSKFVLGTKVIVWASWDRDGRSPSIREVGKVRKDGKFFLRRADGEIDTTMFTPDKYWSDGANQSGAGRRFGDRIELLTPEREARLADRKAELRAQDRRLALMNRVGRLGRSSWLNLSDDQVAALEAIWPKPTGEQ